MKDLEVHVITWRDSGQVSGWVDTEDNTDVEVVVVTTVGLLLSEHDDRIVLAGSLGHSGCALGVLAIPRENIVDHEVWT